MALNQSVEGQADNGRHLMQIARAQHEHKQKYKVQDKRIFICHSKSLNFPPFSKKSSMLSKVGVQVSMLILFFFFCLPDKMIDIEPIGFEV